MEDWWNDTDRGKESTGRENCHNATVCTTDAIGTDLGSNSGLGGEKLATDRLRYVTAFRD